MSTPWPTKRLKDLVDVRVSNVDKKSLPAEKPVRLCNYMDVYANDYIRGQMTFMRATATRAEIDRFGLLSGDVIITKDSETPDDIGVPSVVMEDIEGLVCGYHLALLRPKNDDANPVYIAKQLASSRVARYFGVQANGSTRFGLPLGAIENLELPAPEPEEQDKIAEVLATVDRAIDETAAVVAKQQRIKTGLMQDLLTCGIDEHGTLRSEETHSFETSPLGQVPADWTVHTLGTELSRIKGFLQTGPFGSQLHAHEYVHEGTPVVMPQDITAGRIGTEAIARIPERRAHDLRRHKLCPNDVVFSRRGDLTRAAAIGEREAGWICGTGCFLLRASADRLDANWLADVYRHHWVQRQVETNAVGSTMPSLNNAVMEQLVIAFPSVEEQREITRRRDAADQDIWVTTQQLDKLKAIKRGLMSDLLSGERRVTALLDKREAVTA